jgi:hypothetical protein
MIANKLTLAKHTSIFPFVLFYQGDFKESPTFNIINIVEKHFEPLIDKISLKSLIYLLVESLQNIERYSAHIVSSDDFSFVCSDGEFFYIITENTIHNNKIGELKTRLDTISTKNKKELDETFVAVLKSETGTEKGAGLGLIDIARKSKNKLIYSFDKKNEQHSIYKLGFSLPINKTDDENVFGIEQTSNFLTTVKENFRINKSTLYYGGDFSNSFIKALLTLLVKTKSNEANSTNTKTHHILIELIQNVQRHSLKETNEHAQQVTLEWKTQGLQITTYNLLSELNVKKITDKIAILNSSNREQLMEISKKQLADFTKTDGVGLIDVALLIFPEKIEYLIQEKSKFVYELILTVKVNYES